MISSRRKASIKPSSNWVKCGQKLLPSRISNLFKQQASPFWNTAKKIRWIIPRDKMPQNRKIMILNSNKTIFWCKGLQPYPMPSPGTTAPTRHRTIPWEEMENMFSVRQNLKLKNTKILTNGAFCVCWNTLWFDFSIRVWLVWIKRL